MNNLVEALENIVSHQEHLGYHNSFVLLRAKKALQEHAANKEGWVSMKTRKPTINDANAGGFVVILYNGYPQVKHWEVAASFKTVLWCSLPPLPTPPKTDNK